MPTKQINATMYRVLRPIMYRHPNHTGSELIMPQDAPKGLPMDHLTSSQVDLLIRKKCIAPIISEPAKATA